MHNSIVLGILGGGQLARMTAYAAFRLGIKVHIMASRPGSPAGAIAHSETVADPSDHEALKRFASECDVITLESEFINEQHLEVLERAGHTLYPSSKSVGRIQDKLLQKETLLGADVPVAPFAATHTESDAEAFGAKFGYPFVMKARRNGYDGYGNATIESASDIAAAWQKITRGDPSIGVYCEAFVRFTHELAIMIARGRDGSTITYPVVETVQKNHICHYVIAPADITADTAQTAIAYACRSVKAIDGVGIFGVEFFLTSSGGLLLNEMAPRPHNSGHYTIEACVTSQFENHIRAVMGWPLGSADLRAPAAVMVNILGREADDGAVVNYPEVLAETGAHLHIYDKDASRPGRKMGHVTAVADTVAEAMAIARGAEEKVIFLTPDKTDVVGR